MNNHENNTPDVKNQLRLSTINKTKSDISNFGKMKPFSFVK